MEQRQLRRRVLRILDDPAVDRLYPLFSEWERTAYDQGVRARDRYTANELKDKMASEYLEAKRALNRYFRVIRREHLQRYAEEAITEIGDFANMALIMCPQFVEDDSDIFDGRIPLEIMLLSIYYRSLEYRTRPVFIHDPSRSHDQKKLFATWLREIEAINQTHREKTKGHDPTRTHARRFLLLTRTDHNIEEELDAIDDHLKFDYSEREFMSFPQYRVLVALGNCIVNAMFLLGEFNDPIMAYGDFFRIATEKMKKRDARYHPIARNDEGAS
ncbi:MAG: hypothetical protein HYW25_01085 [Candidatus Aenigmarchaeota archaeon]|nr:hypothetical protein [Candidatus Aenigmarchaeota archaeon]